MSAQQRDVGAISDFVGMTRDSWSSHIALIAGGIIAVHIVDDNYVQPEWGGIADHLASGLVPLVAYYRAVGWRAMNWVWAGAAFYSIGARARFNC